MSDDAGPLLVRAGLIGDDQLLAARGSIARTGGTIGEYLVLAGIVEDDTLTSFYHHRLMVPLVGPNSLARIPKRIIDIIPADMAEEFRIVPVHSDAENNLTLAMSDPSNTHAVDEITFFTGKYVVRAVATQRQLAWCLAHYYGCITSLGETLLQPKPAKPEPSPVDGVPKPIRDRPRNITAEVDASRHHARAPSAAESAEEAPFVKQPRARKHRSLTPATAPIEKISIPEYVASTQPELRERAGEVKVSSGDAHRPTDSLPAVILDDAEHWADDAVIILDRKINRPSSAPPAVDLDEVEADTVDDHTQVDPEPVAEQVDAEPSEVVLLQRKKPITSRRRTKKTRLGIGFFEPKPTPKAKDVRALQPPVLPDARPARPAGKTATNIPKMIRPKRKPAKQPPNLGASPQPPRSKSPTPPKAPATPERIPLRSLGEAFAHATEQPSDRVEAIENAAETEKSAAPEYIAPEVTESDNPTGQFDRIPPDINDTSDVDDGWGPPGTTIPPAFLGAMPDSEVDDDDYLGDGAIPLRTRDDTSGTLKLVRPHTEPQGVPAAVAHQATKAHAAPPPPTPKDSAIVRQREFEDSSAHLVETLRDIDRAGSRDAIIESLLAHMEMAYENVLFFTVKSGQLAAWAPKGSARLASRATLPLNKPSTFQDVVRTRLPYSGDLTDDTSASYLRGILGHNPGRVLMVPLTVRERVVGVLTGSGSKRRAFEEHLSVTARAAGLALERILKARLRK